jgi:hypothetical protein
VQKTVKNALKFRKNGLSYPHDTKVGKDVNNALEMAACYSLRWTETRQIQVQKWQ